MFFVLNFSCENPRGLIVFPARVSKRENPWKQELEVPKHAKKQNRQFLQIARSGSLDLRWKVIFSAERLHRIAEDHAQGTVNKLGRQEVWGPVVLLR